MTHVTLKTRILYEATATMHTLYSRLMAFATTLHFQILATCQATTWLVVTRPVAGELFVSFVANLSFDQSNFAILAMCPHTLAGCVL